MKKLLLAIVLIVGCVSQYGTYTYNSLTSKITYSPELLSYMEELQSQDIPLIITDYHKTLPNSVGGVGIFLDVIFTTNKTIKYIYASFTPYNAVGDKMRCSIRGYESFTGEKTGPYKRYNDKTKAPSILLGWKNVWYNKDIRCIKLDSIKVEYMGGNVRTFAEDTQNVYSSVSIEPLTKLFAPDKYKYDKYRKVRGKFHYSVCSW